MKKWISVKDKLPEKGIKVLGFNNEYNDEYICLVAVNEYIATNSIEVIFENYEPRISKPFITHWMPLPEPPKG